MTVRRIVEMFENMAGSEGSNEPAHPPKSPERGNVHGLVTYYDALGVVKEGPSILPTKTVRIVQSQPVSELQIKGVQKESGQLEQEQVEEELQEDEEGFQNEEKELVMNQCSNQEMSDIPVAPASSPPRLMHDYSLSMSKIPPPKSREHHLAASSICKPLSESAPHSRTFSSVLANMPQPLFVPPPTPVSTRIRGPRTSYAAFATRIENSSSRLLDFEKDERWLGQVETMKCRVETLKRRNQIALAREVASAPRKSRSMSECSGVSTTSTASMSSMDLPEVSCM